jgi:rRNA maturation endonuclease Nob1
MKCVDCKKEVGPGREYCPHCGGELYRHAVAKHSIDTLKVTAIMKNAVSF